MTNGTINTKTKIPLSIAGPMLALTIAGVGWGMSMEARLNAATQDRFRGSDADLWIERFQHVLDDHTRETDAPPIFLPTWRTTHQ